MDKVDVFRLPETLFPRLFRCFLGVRLPFRRQVIRHHHAQRNHIFQCFVHGHIQLADVALSDEDVVATGGIGCGGDIDGNVFSFFGQTENG